MVSMIEYRSRLAACSNEWWQENQDHTHQQSNEIGVHAPTSSTAASSTNETNSEIAEDITRARAKVAMTIATIAAHVGIILQMFQ